MGKHPKITHDTFPKQGKELGTRVKVCFHYDTTKTILGTVVRDDREDPRIFIIKLDDDRYVLDTECMYMYTDV